MQYYHFERLIKKYSSKIAAIIPGKGHYENGEYVNDDDKTVELMAAILDIDRKKIYNSGGTLTTQDKQLYVIGTLTEEIRGAKIIHKGKEYSVEEDTDNSLFTNFTAYILRYVSAFGGVKNG